MDVLLDSERRLWINHSKAATKLEWLVIIARLIGRDLYRAADTIVCDKQVLSR